MKNPYAKAHQAGQHDAWLRGVAAGITLAKSQVWVYGGGDLEWDDVDLALKALGQNQ